MPPSDIDPVALEGPAGPEDQPKRAVRAGASIKAGAPVAGLVPRTIEEAWRLAVAIARSRLAPKDMQRPEQIMVAIMGGAELGIPPFSALQSFAVINNRPVMWGDGLLGVVRARGVKVKEWAEGEGEAMVAWCTVTRPDTDEEPTTRFFSVDDAKRAKLWMKKGANGADTPWVTYPRRMLQMRARSWAIRDGCADILRGIQVREEVEDYDDVEVRDVTPTVSQFLAADVAEGEDAEIEIVDAVVEEPVTHDDAPTETVATVAAEDESATEPEQVEVKNRRSGLKQPPQADTPEN
jgi:hypothetical protein